VTSRLEKIIHTVLDEPDRGHVHKVYLRAELTVLQVQSLCDVPKHVYGEELCIARVIRNMEPEVWDILVKAGY